MVQFRCGHAKANQWQEAAQSCLMQLGQVTDSDNLGFLYVTDLLAEYLTEILNYVKQHTQVPHWVGTVGIGICSQNQEYFDEPAIAMMVGQFSDHTFQVFTEITEEFKEFARTHQSWCDSKRPMFAVVHGDSRHDQISNLIFQLSERLGEGFLVGGLTSSRHQNLQIADEVIDSGLSGVLFSSAVEVVTCLTQGCSAIGPRHQITESSHNIIIRIDDRPALDVFNEDIGQELAENINKIAGYIFAALPLRGSDTGDYMVRNLIGIDPEHKLLAIGDVVTPGMSIMFTCRDAQTAYKDLLNMLNRLKIRLHGKTPKGGIYYSCLGRGKNLFGKGSKEIKTIQRLLGDFPLVGFFANGEIYHQRLYGYTGVLTLFL